MSVQILPGKKNNYKFIEKTFEDGYYYEIYVFIKDGEKQPRKAAIVVTPHDLSVVYETEDAVVTNVTPKLIFKNKPQLQWPHLAYLIILLEWIGLEGKYFSPEEMQRLHVID